MARKSTKAAAVVLPPLTTADARAALVTAGIKVGVKGKLSSENKALAEELTGRKFA